MVKTAVLMATYNGEHFITDQLDSIRQQTLAPDYVLIRDDCSTDHTVHVVEDYIKYYQLDNWSIIKNEVNLNWRLNFRELLKDSRQLEVDYIFFSDQDDIWYLDKNQSQVIIMEENPHIDLLSADIDVETISSDATVPDNFQFVDKERKISQYPIDMTYHNYRQGWTFCIRKKFVDMIVIHYHEGQVLAHDNLMTGISGVLGTGYNFNCSVGLHNRHGNNASGNILSFRSSRSHHLQDLTFVTSYYQILTDVLNQQDHTSNRLALKYRNFSQKRLENAKNRQWLATIRQIINEGRYYDNFSNRLRDLVFLIKK